MRVLLVLILILMTSCFVPRKTHRYIDGYKVLYSDTIRYSCGKTKVVHYYEE